MSSILPCFLNLVNSETSNNNIQSSWQHSFLCRIGDSPPFGRSITSHEVRQMNLVDPIIVRLPRTPLAICSAPSPPHPYRNPIPTFAPSPIAPCPRAYVSAILPSPLAIALDPSLPSSNPAIASSPSAYLRHSSPSPRPLVSSPSARLLRYYPICDPSSRCLSLRLRVNHYPQPLPTLAEADFGIFPKLRHEELKKAPIRRFGAGITSVKHEGRDSLTLTISTLLVDGSAHSSW